MIKPIYRLMYCGSLLHYACLDMRRILKNRSLYKIISIEIANLDLYFQSSSQSGLTSFSNFRIMYMLKLLMNQSYKFTVTSSVKLVRG